MKNLITVFSFLFMYLLSSAQNSTTKANNAANQQQDLKSIYEVFAVKKNGVELKGLKDKTGKILLQPIYSDIELYKDYGKVTDPRTNMVYFMNANAKLSAHKYGDIGEFSSGLAHVFIEIKSEVYKEGYINKKGEEVIPVIYDDAAKVFIEGVAFVGKEQKNGEMLYALIDSSGNLKTAFIYSSISDFSCEKCLIVSKPDKEVIRRYGFINKEGKEIVVPIFLSVSCFTNEEPKSQLRKDSIIILTRQEIWLIDCLHSTAHNVSICKSRAEYCSINYVQASTEVQAGHSMFNYSS